MARRDLSALSARIGTVDWREVETSLETRGYATIANLLSPEECRELSALYDEDARFRSRVVMARHGYGSGEYKYFGYPLPPPVQALREAIYPRLVPIANRWRTALAEKGAFPPELAGFLAQCHRAGQGRPTPLLLKYGPDDYNALHQDLYGELAFPLQATVLLSEPGADFAGGEFLLVEQRPRMQSRGEVVPLRQGETVIFAVRHRPRQGTRGVHRVTLRHGVSRLRAGRRLTLGIIFHDAA
ncbi:MAG TPA: 2OG-Fe(II) oxygenase [Stellaceae bacterium]|nr:2OG-Fe(II) oxygenase [Stellaceae bacterium]